MPKAMSKLREKKLKKEFLIRYEENLGILSPTLKQIGITHYYYHKWMDFDPEFKEDVLSVDRMVVDFGETALYKNVKAGKEQSIFYLLNAKGSDRGYGKLKIDQNVSTTEPVKINIIKPDEEKKD